MKKLMALLLSLCLVLAQLTFAAAEDYGTAYINGGSNDRVHLRVSPDASDYSMGLYFTGTQVACLSSLAEEWVRVCVGVEVGFMKAAYLTTSAPVSRQPIGTVTSASGKFVNLRTESTTAAAVLAEMGVGEQVTVLGETADQWYLVQYGALQGYVMANFIRLEAATATLAPETGEGANVPEALRIVLAGEGTMLNMEDGQAAMLDSLLNDTFETAMRFSRFALADFDADGMNEVIAEIERNGEPFSYELLDWQSLVVCGYPLPYRGFLSPKADGTAGYSGGAADSGFGRLAVGQTEAMVQPSTWSESDGNGHVTYYVNGSVADEAAFNDALTAQDQKPDLQWFDFTAEEIAAHLR